MKIKNIVIFLNGNRGVAVLDYLLTQNLKISAVITSEASEFSHMSHKYKDLNVVVKSNVNDSESIEKLRSYESDVFIVAGFSSILKKELLKVPKLGVINLHGGPLPKYRGGSPLNWQIINDEKTIGVSLIFMNEGLDTGDVIAEGSFELEESDDIFSVHQKANKLFVELISKSFKEIEDSVLTVRTQFEGAAQYWVQRTPEESLIKWWELTARQVFNKIRALKPPYPSAFTFYNGTKVFLYDSLVPKTIVRGTPGRVVHIQGTGPYVICKDRAIIINDASIKLSGGICGYVPYVEE